MIMHPVMMQSLAQLIFRCTDACPRNLVSVYVRDIQLLQNANKQLKACGKVPTLLSLLFIFHRVVVNYSTVIQMFQKLVIC